MLKIFTFFFCNPRTSRNTGRNKKKAKKYDYFKIIHIYSKFLSDEIKKIGIDVFFANPDPQQILPRTRISLRQHGVRGKHS